MNRVVKLVLLTDTVITPPPLYHSLITCSFLKHFYSLLYDNLKNYTPFFAGSAFPSPDEVERMKSGVMLYITSDIVPVKEIVAHLIIASSDSRHTIATAGENELRRVSR